MVNDAAKAPLSVEERLRIFDAGTERQARRKPSAGKARGVARGWRRDDLYREVDCGDK
jgi:hypothetical protein